MRVASMLSERVNWHNSAWQQLERAHQTKGLPHALLISGSDGIGKRLLAKQIAASVLCEGGTLQACGFCRSCQIMTEADHPDCHLVAPLEAGKSIKIDSIRQVNELASMTAQLGAKQVFIVEQADSLTTSASNALLKTLEEPSAHTLFLLVVSQVGRVLPTIRSRCQLVAAKQPTTDEAKAWLMQHDVSLPSDEWVTLFGKQPFLLAEILQDEKRSEQYCELQAGVQSCLQDKNAITMYSAKWQSLELKDFLHMLERVIMQKAELGESGGGFAVEYPALLRKIMLIYKALNNQLHLNKQLVMEELLLHLHKLAA